MKNDVMEQQALVEKYMPLANKLAYKKKKVLPRHVDFEELQSAAYLGLVEAASRYDVNKGVAFSTYAVPRIFGAIHDYLRQQGWGKRGEYLTVHSLDSSIDDDCCLKDTVELRPERNDGEFLECISHILEDEDSKKILQYYFIDEFSMKEVGEKFGISESRISQIFKKYKARILSSWDEQSLRSELAA